MRRKAERNATSLARRFESLAGLKLLLSNELEASKEARDKALKMLEELSAAIDARPDSLVEQVCTVSFLRDSFKSTSNKHAYQGRQYMTRTQDWT